MAPGIIIKEGWNTDPTHRHELRYHDGNKWTDHVSDQGEQSTDPFAGGGVPAPPKPKKNRTWLKVLTGLCVLGLVFIGGCVALIGVGANEVSKQLDKEQKAHAISKTRFDSMSLGMTEAQVVKKAGKQPEDKQEFQSESFVGKEPANSSCIYYNRSGGQFGDVFQFCFTSGKLDAKTAY